VRFAYPYYFQKSIQMKSVGPAAALWENVQKQPFYTGTFSTHLRRLSQGAHHVPELVATVLFSALFKNVL
jgi:hypothetical protein